MSKGKREVILCRRGCALFFSFANQNDVNAYVKKKNINFNSSVYCTIRSAAIAPEKHPSSHRLDLHRDPILRVGVK